MTYRVRHRTEYAYDQPVTSSYGEMHLLPRDVDGQVCHSTVITIDRARRAVLTERTFDAAGLETGMRTLELTLERLPGERPEAVNSSPAA